MHISLRTLLIAAIVFMLFFAGCIPLGPKELLTVDFQKDNTLRYEFISSRDVTLDWGQMAKDGQKGKSSTQKSSESLKMIVVYEPVEIDLYGLTTVRATVESVKVERAGQRGRSANRDAVETLPGKTFTFTISSLGKIEDYSQLNELIKETAEQAFRTKNKQSRIKDPDMISDFVATQWFLWDAIATIPTPIEGISIGQTWDSTLWVPLPMVVRKARDVTYKLSEIRDTKEGKIAVITSTYSPGKSLPSKWPQPYKGSFRMSGTFGFLSNYKMLDLQGSGEELFNIDKGITRQYNQSFNMKLKASLAMPIGSGPKINIKHKLTMRLLEKK